MIQISGWKTLFVFRFFISAAKMVCSFYLIMSNVLGIVGCYLIHSNSRIQYSLMVSFLILSARVNIHKIPRQLHTSSIPFVRVPVVKSNAH